MKKVLYITANPKQEAMSYSMAAGRTFLELYKEQNPNHEIIELDVYKEEIPMIDEIVFSGWGKLRTGVEFTQLTEPEQKQVGKIAQLTEQFKSADKYIFVTPMWNLSLPPMMKAYIDTFMIAGETFKYTEKGPIGMLNDKKALHIQASGGIYSEGPAREMDFSSKYMKAALGFVGITDVTTIAIEGTNMGQPEHEIKERASVQVKTLASSF